MWLGTVLDSLDVGSAPTEGQHPGEAEEAQQEAKLMEVEEFRQAAVAQHKEIADLNKRLTQQNDDVTAPHIVQLKQGDRTWPTKLRLCLECRFLRQCAWT
jgi:hypothetical protein